MKEHRFTYIYTHTAADESGEKKGEKKKMLS